MVRDDLQIHFFTKDINLTSQGWESFWYDVFETTVFHQFQQSSTTIKTGMLDKTYLNNNNCLTFLLQTIDTHQSIDNYGDSSIFCIHRVLYVHHVHHVLWKLEHGEDVYLGKPPVNFQVVVVRNVANSKLVLASGPSYLSFCFGRDFHGNNHEKPFHVVTISHTNLRDVHARWRLLVVRSFFSKFFVFTSTHSVTSFGRG